MLEIAGLLAQSSILGQVEFGAALWFYPGGLDFWGGPSPDGRYVTYVDWNTENLAVHDFQTGGDRQLTTIGSLPDSGFAVTSALVMPTAGGEARELLTRNKGEPWPQVVEWSHDAIYVYYVLWGGPKEDPSRGLWRVPAGGGEHEQLDWYMEFDVKQIPSFHPDGRRIGFTVAEFGAEVWVMEDFLPMELAGSSDEQ